MKSFTFQAPARVMRSGAVSGVGTGTGRPVGDDAEARILQARFAREAHDYRLKPRAVKAGQLSRAR